VCQRNCVNIQWGTIIILLEVFRKTWAGAALAGAAGSVAGGIKMGGMYLSMKNRIGRFATGIQNDFNDFTDDMGRAGSAVASAASTAWKGITSAESAAWTGVKNFGQSVKNKVAYGVYGTDTDSDVLNAKFQEMWNSDAVSKVVTGYGASSMSYGKYLETNLKITTDSNGNTVLATKKATAFGDRENEDDTSGMSEQQFEEADSKQSFLGKFFHNKTIMWKNAWSTTVRASEEGLSGYENITERELFGNDSSGEAAFDKVVGSLKDSLLQEAKGDYMDKVLNSWESTGGFLNGDNLLQAAALGGAYLYFSEGAGYTHTFKNGIIAGGEFGWDNSDPKNNCSGKVIIGGENSDVTAKATFEAGKEMDNDSGKINNRFDSNVEIQTKDFGGKYEFEIDTSKNSTTITNSLSGKYQINKNISIYGGGSYSSQSDGSNSWNINSGWQYSGQYRVNADIGFGKNYNNSNEYSLKWSFSTKINIFGDKKTVDKLKKIGKNN